MGSKHPYDDSVHPSRRQNIPSATSRPTKKQRKESDEASSQPQSTKSISALKPKIRDLSRLLAHCDRLPADVRLEKERALASYEADLQEAVEEKKKSVMISRYHMVRFFERQKATRALKKLRKQLEASSLSSPEHAKLEKAVHEAEVDLNYTLFYPFAKKYHSLYPRTPEQGPENEHEIGGKGERKVGGQRPPLWSLVEISMAGGTLEALRDGKAGILVAERRKPLVRPSVVVRNLKKPAREGPAEGTKSSGGAGSEDEEDDMSDGGFFER